MIFSLFQPVEIHSKVTRQLLARIDPCLAMVPVGWNYYAILIITRVPHDKKKKKKKKKTKGLCVPTFYIMK